MLEATDLQAAEEVNKVNLRLGSQHHFRFVLEGSHVGLQEKRPAALVVVVKSCGL